MGGAHDYTTERSGWRACFCYRALMACVAVGVCVCVVAPSAPAARWVAPLVSAWSVQCFRQASSAQQAPHHPACTTVPPPGPQERGASEACSQACSRAQEKHRRGGSHSVQGLAQIGGARWEAAQCCSSRRCCTPIAPPGWPAKARRVATPRGRGTRPPMARRQPSALCGGPDAC